MSRYIDADAVIEDAFNLMDRDELLEDVPQIIKDYCDAQPTVDAIPISFIEKKIDAIRQYLKEHEGEAFTSGLISKAIAYEKLIEYWREDNGQAD